MSSVPRITTRRRTTRPPRTVPRFTSSVALVTAVVFTVVGCAPAKAPPSSQSQDPLAPVGQGFTLNAGDLRFILNQIKVAENHAAGNPLLGPGPNQVPDARLPYGLRTVDGSLNNLLPDQQNFGKADRVFPRLVPAEFRDAEPVPPGFPGAGSPTSYTQKRGLVVDSHPRLVSNLIVDQTASNPAATVAAGANPEIDPLSLAYVIPNTAPDVGLSAPYNSLFTLFGQFFDHGLDLVTKGGGTVFIPLHPTDPLFDPTPGAPNFMVVTRATNQPGPDGVLGDIPGTPVDESADDIQDGTNTTTPFVDQNQTYTSHPSHQVFLRAYRMVAGRPVATGKLLDGNPLPDGTPSKNIGNWAEVKAQAASMLGIALSDTDVVNVPLLATDAYGRFKRGPNGFAQLVMADGTLVEGNPAAPIPTTGSVKTGHAFLDDIAHHAAPIGDNDGNPSTPPGPLAPDADTVAGPDDGAGTTYDNELLEAHFITGDGRGNENIGLTAIHAVFHSEHNRLADDIHNLINVTPIVTAAEALEWNAVNPASGWDYGERLFQAARFVTEMEYQHLVFEEFARKVQPMVNLFAGYHTEIDPAIAAEFAHTVYRFGHSMLNETVARALPDGTRADMPLLDAFLNPLAFNNLGGAAPLTADQAVGAIVRGMSRQVGNEIDEFITEALRNDLLGLPLDLATINMARGRSEGVPRLNAARRHFYAVTSHPALAPYESWADFKLGLRHTESLVNFVAAYGRHDTIVAAGSDLAARRAAAQLLVDADPLNPATPTDAFAFMTGTGAYVPAGSLPTGLEDVDFWVGGLAEKQAPFGGLLGATFNYVFETQLEKLQDGDRFYYLTRTAGLNLLVQLEGNSFAELVMRNSDAEGLPADIFSWPEMTFNVAVLGTAGPIIDDVATSWNEASELIRMPNGTIRYAGPAHVVFNGGDDAAVVDRIWSSEGDDTLRGNGGVDIMEGGAGNDQFIGGEGNDILTDAFGDDVLKGGHGNDAMSSGPGFDLNQGGLGHDFIVGGSDPTESFGGPGNDLIFAGDSADTVFGDDGDDWIQGGGQADLLQGDNGAPFFNDLNAPGNDVLMGEGGDDDYDAEGGDDIMIAGPGVERNAGMFGFDWVTHYNDPQPAFADLNIFVFAAPDVDTFRDRYAQVEGLSGWRFNDTLFGSSAIAADLANGDQLTPEGVARITGLAEVLGGATSFADGDIILGGAGSDLIIGREGNDIIDGDRWLKVQLRAPNPATADPADTQLVDNMMTVRAAVFAGQIDPGEISIVRTVVTEGVQAGDVDIAQYSGLRAEYVITRLGDVTTIDHQGGLATDGIDTLRNVELLQFADVTIPVPTSATGTVTISDTTPAEDQLLTVTSTLSDPDGVNQATLVYVWEVETAPNTWTFVAQGPEFAPGDAQVGLRIRAAATFLDNVGANERVTSDPTAAVTPVNDPATVTLNDTTPEVGGVLAFTVTDPDGVGPLTIQWLSNGANIAAATGQTFTPTAAFVGQQISVRVSFTDNQGFAQTVTSAQSAPVAVPVGPLLGVQGVFNFGVRRLNNTTQGQIDVTNPGVLPLQVRTVSVSGAPFIAANLGTCAAPLAPGRRCRITVSFRPTTPGPANGSLTIVSNATNSPTTVVLTGTGR